MSVAFRREEDEQHLEPKFEIPIPPGPNRVTARGLALIGTRIAALEAALQTPLDDSAAEQAKRELRYWQTRQITAEMVPPASGDTVEFGTRVTILHKGKRRVLTLVGDDEAEPARGLISFSAPLSRALIGAEVGDTVAFAGEEDAIEILEIAPVATDEE